MMMTGERACPCAENTAVFYYRQDVKINLAVMPCNLACSSYLLWNRALVLVRKVVNLMLEILTFYSQIYLQITNHAGK